MNNYFRGNLLTNDPNPFVGGRHCYLECFSTTLGRSDYKTKCRGKLSLTHLTNFLEINDRSVDGQYLIQRLELTTLISFVLTAVNVLAKRLIISLLVIN